jgi:Txe/YoeB family toxin of toxin-antitoxin system
VVTWNLAYSKYAIRDAKKISAAGLKDKAQTLLDILKVDPFQNPPPYEKLVGDLKGAYSRRINIQHRLVYEIVRKEKTVRVLRMWTHYE